MQDLGRPRLGISTCLLGKNVRSDGGHRRDDFLVRTIGRFVEWVPVCPEVEMGLRTPRPSMRLVGSAEAPRLVLSRGEEDFTERMQTWAAARLEELAALDLHGYVFKKDSPSCGVFRVKVYAPAGAPARTGRGLFALLLTRRLPLLPVEEEGRLCDPRLRENFVERIFAYERWVRFLRGPEGGRRPAARDLVAFHTSHKLALLAHSPAHYRRLGRVVAEAGRRPFSQVATEYGTLFLEALAVLATPGRHANVLEHALGFLKDRLDAADKAEMGALVRDHRLGQVPLVVPLTLLRHHLHRHEVPDWLRLQTYLDPYPRELLLRNHV